MVTGAAWCWFCDSVRWAVPWADGINVMLAGLDWTAREIFHKRFYKNSNPIINNVCVCVVVVVVNCFRPPVGGLSFSFKYG
jgi:hypothetical protein